jgi:hypothetical protein
LSDSCGYCIENPSDFTGVVFQQQDTHRGWCNFGRSCLFQNFSFYKLDQKDNYIWNSQLHSFDLLVQLLKVRNDGERIPNLQHLRTSTYLHFCLHDLCPSFNRVRLCANKVLIVWECIEMKHALEYLIHPAKFDAAEVSSYWKSPRTRKCDVGLMRKGLAQVAEHILLAQTSVRDFYAPFLRAEALKDCAYGYIFQSATMLQLRQLFRAEFSVAPTEAALSVEEVLELHNHAMEVWSIDVGSLSVTVAGCLYNWLNPALKFQENDLDISISGWPAVGWLNCVKKLIGYDMCASTGRGRHVFSEFVAHMRILERELEWSLPSISLMYQVGSRLEYMLLLSDYVPHTLVAQLAPDGRQVLFWDLQAAILSKCIDQKQGPTLFAADHLLPTLNDSRLCNRILVQAPLMDSALGAMKFNPTPPGPTCQWLCHIHDILLGWGRPFALVQFTPKAQSQSAHKRAFDVIRACPRALLNPLNERRESACGTKQTRSAYLQPYWMSQRSSQPQRSWSPSSKSDCKLPPAKLRL